MTTKIDREILTNNGRDDGPVDTACFKDFKKIKVGPEPLAEFWELCNCSEYNEQCKEQGGKCACSDCGKKAIKLTGYKDIDIFLDECLSTMRSKGHDYRQGNDADVLHNFRSVAEMVDTSMEKVWFTYFYKHYSAMTTFIKEGGQSESEPIEGRIKDQIVYLLLFYRMVQEQKRSNAPKKMQTSEQVIKGLEDKGYSFITEKELEKALPFLAERKKVEIPLEPFGLTDDGRITVPNVQMIEVNPEKLKRLAGLIPSKPGTQPFEEDTSMKVLPTLPDGEVLARSAEITRELAERDSEFAKTHVPGIPGPVGPGAITWNEETHKAQFPDVKNYDMPEEAGSLAQATEPTAPSVTPVADGMDTRCALS